MAPKVGKHMSRTNWNCSWLQKFANLQASILTNAVFHSRTQASPKPKATIPKARSVFSKELFVCKTTVKFNPHAGIRPPWKCVFLLKACKFAILAPASQAKTEPAKKLVLCSDCARKKHWGKIGKAVYPRLYWQNMTQFYSVESRLI